MFPWGRGCVQECSLARLPHEFKPWIKVNNHVYHP